MGIVNGMLEAEWPLVCIDVTERALLVESGAKAVGPGRLATSLETEW